MLPAQQPTQHAPAPPAQHLAQHGPAPRKIEAMVGGAPPRGGEPRCAEAHRDRSSEIKGLEQTLRTIPNGLHFDDLRGNIKAQIQELKREITKSRPLGAQVDTCKSAMDRAERRKSEALDAMAAAKLQIEEADAEITRLQEELKDLQSMVQAHPSAHADAEDGGDCMEVMVSAMQRVMEEMRSSGRVAPQLIAQAEKDAEKLTNGIGAIAALARTAAPAVHARAHARTGGPQAPSGGRASPPAGARPTRRPPRRTPRPCRVL